MESVFSSSWYRVASLRPRLKEHAQIHRHHYRGQLWYVLQDLSSGSNHRFSPQVHYVLSMMDGCRTLQQIWDLALESLGDDAPTQPEMVKLLGQLHGNDLLLCDVSPDTLELFQRFQRKQKSKWKQRLWSPLSIRFPLWDPDAFLTKWLDLVSPLFGWVGKLVWVGVVLSAVVLASSHWPDLSENVADRVLAPGNLLVLFFVYPLVKLLHELGHGFATKIWNGEVHEMGIMLLVFMPIPYVDASSAWAFRERKKRVIVGAAGMGVELFLASVALFVWLNVEQGLVRVIAYNVILIGSVSTLFFNGNPLLRFDGYYIFSDLIEIPNLSSRANNFFGYLFQRYLFGVQHATSPANTVGERVWFVIYGSASFLYRMLITFAIILFVAGKFFLIGILLALWAGTTQLLTPIIKLIRFLFTSPVIQRKRIRAITGSCSMVAAIFGFLFLVPMPLNTYAEGVVWLPEQSKIRIKTQGFITGIRAQPNAPVKRGEILMALDDPLLTMQKTIFEYRKEELKAQLKEAWAEDKVHASILEEQIETVEAEIADIVERVENMTLRSPIDGIFIVPQAEDMADRFMNKGELAAYVVNFPATTILAVVTQDDIGLVRERTRDVEVRLAENTKNLYPATVLREIPAASDHLPSSALGLAGGGVIPVDPASRDGIRAYEPVFQIELRFPPEADARNLGERVYIRFDHGSESLAMQLYRAGRQLFLRRFGV